MKKAQRHHDYLSSEWKKKSKYLNQRKKSPQVPKTISKFLTVRSCDKKSKKKTWTTKMKIEEKNTWNQSVTANEKRKKNSKLGHRLIENQEKQKTLFSLLSKNHNSITTPKKKSIPFFRRKNRWFINLIFFIVVFSVLFFASHCGFFEQFLAKKPDYATTRPLLLHTTITIIC